MAKEIWKDVPGYEGHYKASNLGRVKCLTRKVSRNRCGNFKVQGRILRVSKTALGYYKLTLRKDSVSKTMMVHRIVLSAFRGESQLWINHKNGNRIDNRLVNLEYVTARENICHALLKNVGSLNSKYRVKEGKWYSVMKHDGKNHFLGSFDTQEESQKAYRKALKKFGIKNKYATKRKTK